MYVSQMRVFTESNHNTVDLVELVSLTNILSSMSSIYISSIGKLIPHMVENQGPTHNGTYLEISENLTGPIGEIKIYYPNSYYYVCYVHGVEGFWNISSIIKHLQEHIKYGY